MLRIDHRYQIDGGLSLSLFTRHNSRLLLIQSYHWAVIPGAATTKRMELWLVNNERDMALQLIPTPTVLILMAYRIGHSFCRPRELLQINSPKISAVWWYTAFPGNIVVTGLQCNHFFITDFWNSILHCDLKLCRPPLCKLPLFFFIALKHTFQLFRETPCKLGSKWEGVYAQPVYKRAFGSLL